MPTIFTKIIQGELPSYKVYEDDLVLAFLDINPVHLGHCLVIPKREVNHYCDMGDPDFAAVNDVARRLGRAIREATGCPRVGTAIVGFEVQHAHVHLIPLWAISDLDFRLGKKRSPEDMKMIQEKIIEALPH